MTWDFGVRSWEVGSIKHLTMCALAPRQLLEIMLFHHWTTLPLCLMSGGQLYWHCWSRHSNRYVCTYVHGSQKVRTVKMSTNKWIAKQTILYARNWVFHFVYRGMLFKCTFYSWRKAGPGYPFMCFCLSSRAMASVDIISKMKTKLMGWEHTIFPVV